MPLRTILLVLVFLLFLPRSMVAVSPADSGVPAVGSLTHFIPVPLTRQATDFTCGVAALQAVLGFYGREFREDQLRAKLTVDPENGTAYQSMVTFAKSLGFEAEAQTGLSLEELRTFIDRGRPIIVCLQAGPDTKVAYKNDWDDGHYAVVVGYDTDRVYFMDPSTLGYYTFIPVDEFLERWHDTDGREKLSRFGLILTPGQDGSPGYDPGRILKMD